MADNSYELDDGYGDDGSYEETIPAPVGASAAPDLNALVEKGHITSDQVLNKQQKVLIFHMHASPEQAARQPSLCESRIQDSNQRHLQEVRSINNRHDPKDEHRSGDLDQIVITKFQTIAVINECNHPVFVDFVGTQVPGMLTSNDRTNLVLEHAPTLTPYTVDIHDPVNMMLRDMLQIWERCDDTVLAKEFHWIDAADGKKACLLCRDGAGANLLKRAPEKYGGFRLGNKVVEGTNMTPIPSEVGQQLYTEMKNTIEMIKKSFVSAKDIRAQFRPDNGRWNDVSRYLGDVMTISEDRQVEHNQRMLNKKNRVAVHVLMEYIPVPKQYAPETKQ